MILWVRNSIPRQASMPCAEIPLPLLLRGKSPIGSLAFKIHDALNSQNYSSHVSEHYNYSVVMMHEPHLGCDVSPRTSGRSE